MNFQLYKLILQDHIRPHAKGGSALFFWHQDINPGQRRIFLLIGGNTPNRKDNNGIFDEQ